MGSRIRSIFLGALILSTSVWAQETPPVVMEPEVKRRSINEADIDTEDFEVGVFVGNLSIEDFGSDVLVGARLTYHISESFFTEASYGQSTAGQTSFEVLSGGAPLLTEEQRDFQFYDLSLGYRFTGETFLTQNWVFNSDFYFSAGAGIADFAADERFTVNFGAGYRILLTDWLSVRVDARDYVFSSEIVGPKKSTHNLAFSLGVAAFF